VDIRLATAATVENVLALRPDAVVIATGGRANVTGASKFHPMPIRGSDQAFVIDHERAVIDAEHLPDPVIVLDAVGHIEAIGVGELLASLGKTVTVVTPLPMPMLLDRETMGVALPRAVRAGMRWRPNTVLGAIGEHSVTLVDTLSGQAETMSPVHTAVIRTHGLPNDALYFALRRQVTEVARVGDAIAVRPVDRAIFDGHVVGRAL
jgi:pyruvate/2-oxoglutarate dehydrogenase complex dihydrolipoamide dehydrogenase (E3) component